MKKKGLLLLGLCAVLMSVTACGNNQAKVEETTTTEATTEEITKKEIETTTEEETTEEETTEEETTKEETKASGSGSRITELSDDIYSFQVSIDGDIYQCPFPYGQLIDDGWSYSGDDTLTLRTSAYDISDWFKRGDVKFMTDVANFDINEHPVNECYIGGFILDKSDMKDAAAEITLPKGITLGESTADEVKAAYGDPSETYDGNYSQKLTYKMDNYSYVEISIGNDSGVVEKIELQHLVQPDDFEAGDVDSSVPAIVGAYKAPSELGDDLNVYKVEFAGDLYTLPAPVSTFVDNGWKIVDNAGAEVAGKDYAWITIMKNNQQLQVIVNNYSSNATAIENCFFTDVKSDKYGCNVDMSIPGGISVGMSEDDLLAALSSTTYDTENSTTLTFYKVDDVDSSTDGLSFTVEEGKLIGIEVKYQPRMEKFYSALGVQE